MIKASDLAVVGFKYIGRSYEEMDCQKLVERCLRDCGNNTDLPGSNAWYRKMTWTGTPEECKRKFGSVPAGAFLFILEFDGGEVKRGYHDGLGNASHIGIVTGSGKGAIHSSESRGGVVESEFKGKTIKNGGWNRVGLWDRVDYGDRINRILRGEDGSGDSGDDDGGRKGEAMGDKATVIAQSGETVNMRKGKSTESDRICKVPIGAKVDLISYGDDWCLIGWNGKTGYMMTQFLIIGDVTPGGDEEKGIDPNTVLVQRSILENMYSQLADVLGIRG